MCSNFLEGKTEARAPCLSTKERDQWCCFPVMSTSIIKMYGIKNLHFFFFLVAKEVMSGISSLSEQRESLSQVCVLIFEYNVQLATRSVCTFFF